MDICEHYIKYLVYSCPYTTRLLFMHDLGIVNVYNFISKSKKVVSMIGTGLPSEYSKRNAWSTKTSMKSLLMDGAQAFIIVGCMIHLEEMELSQNLTLLGHINDLNPPYLILCPYRFIIANSLNNDQITISVT